MPKGSVDITTPTGEQLTLCHCWVEDDVALVTRRQLRAILAMQGGSQAVARDHHGTVVAITTSPV